MLKHACEEIFQCNFCINFQFQVTHASTLKSDLTFFFFFFASVHKSCIMISTWHWSGFQLLQEWHVGGEQGVVKIETLDRDLFNDWHKIAHVMSYVHVPNNRLENKNSRCRNPSSSHWIWIKGGWVILRSTKRSTTSLWELLQNSPFSSYFPMPF